MPVGDGKKTFGRGTRDLSGIRVPSTGPVPCVIMLVEERPGKQDVQAYPPEALSGIAGREMDRYLHESPLHRDNAFFTYLVRDYREGKAPDDWEIARDQWELDAEIETIEPYIIAALGGHSTRYLLDADVDMEVVHGIPFQRVHPTLGPQLIVPIYHPPSGFYNADTQPIILEDFRRLGQVIRGEIAARDLNGPGAPWRAWHEPSWINPFETSQIALDTEGWLHNPWGLSVSFRDGIGIVAKKGDYSIDRVAANIEYCVAHDPDFTVYLHNSLHDLPILDGLGVPIPEGRYRDTMVLAYLLCTEPQGLKPLAFRHCDMRMSSYEEVVGPYFRAVFEEYICTAASLDGLPDWEEESIIYVNEQAKLRKPWGIARHLRRIVKDAAKAAEVGAVFDFAKRWDNIDDYKKEPVLARLGEPPEFSLEYVPEDEAIPYSGCDAVATRRIAPILERRIVEMGLQEIARTDHAVLPMFDRMQRIGIMADPEHYDRLAEECTAEMKVIQNKIKEATHGWVINPDSGDQVAALIFDHMKLDREVDFRIARTDAGDRYSTNDKILEALRFTNDVVGMVCDYREVSKIRSSFCWPIARYARATPNRRIHPNFRLTRVSSGRPSCSKPNLLAIPVRSKLGKRVREGLIAAPGHVLYDIDLSQVEMRYMADESQDDSLINAFLNNEDVHDQTGAKLAGVPSLADYVADKSLRKKWRDPAKRVNFGVITQITKHGLIAQMRLANASKNSIPLGVPGSEPWTEADCDKMLQDYFTLRVGVRRYIDDCRAEVRRFGYVRDRYGRYRMLPGVHSPIKHIAEEALRQSSSHKIQAGAAYIMKRNQAAIWEQILKWREQGWYCEPLLQVYDELLLEVTDDEGFKQEVDEACTRLMTETVQLYSVPLGAEGGFGRNWTEAKG